ncbi:hypothetical protein pb186bvf_004957 [Paramecium bursaria]
MFLPSIKIIQFSILITYFNLLRTIQFSQLSIRRPFILILRNQRRYKTQKYIQQLRSNTYWIITIDDLLELFSDFKFQRIIFDYDLNIIKHNKVTLELFGERNIQQYHTVHKTSKLSALTIVPKSQLFKVYKINLQLKSIIVNLRDGKLNTQQKFVLSDHFIKINCKSIIQELDEKQNIDVQNLISLRKKQIMQKQNGKQSKVPFQMLFQTNGILILSSSQQIFWNNSSNQEEEHQIGLISIKKI